MNLHPSLNNFDFDLVNYPCSKTGPILAQVFQGKPALDGILDLVRSNAGEIFKNVSDGTIIDWYLALPSNTTFSGEQVQERIKRECQEDFCQAFEWQGNPDLAGAGVRTCRSSHR